MDLNVSYVTYKPITTILPLYLFKVREGQANYYPFTENDLIKPIEKNSIHSVDFKAKIGKSSAKAKF